MSDIPTAQELDGMTKDELLAVANEDMGLNVSPSATKSEVRAAINASISAAMSPPTGGQSDETVVPTSSYGVPMVPVSGTGQWYEPVAVATPTGG